MLIKEFIDFCASSVLLEIRGTFKWPEFKKLKSLEEKFQYASDNLDSIGSGSAAGGSRAVFILSNRYVLKVARPQKAAAGIAQNKAEAQVYSNPAAKEMVPTIYDNDPQFHWLVSEIANPIKSEQAFEQITKINWGLFADIIRNYKNPAAAIEAEIEEKQEAVKLWAKRGNTEKANRFQQIINNLQNVLKNPTVVGALDLINKANLMPGDLWELKHWALTADGRLVIIDTGFTRDSAETVIGSGAAA